MNAQSPIRYWRNLEELADTPEFQASLHREFPALASEWADPVSRRSFLKLMSASFALAGLTACTRQPIEKLVPYVKQPEEATPGEALFFATAMPCSGYGLGLLVESHEGRPTKIEGNPQHPVSLGATNAFAQASILDLYDPDRAQSVLNAGEISSWNAFLGALNDALQAQVRQRGTGLRLLTGTVTSPTIAWQIKRFLEKFPQAKWHQYEPINRDSELTAMEELFGKALRPQYDFEKASVIVSLEADFLFSHPASLRYAQQFTNGRRVIDRARMNRLYVVESSPTITGAMADHRLPLRASRIEELAHALLTELGLRAPASPPANVQLRSLPAGTPALPGQWLRAAAADLKQTRGSCLVIAGDQQPSAVHVLAHYLNQRLGNIGQTVHYTERVEATPVRQLDSLRELTLEMQRGTIDLLLIIGANPVFSAPVDFDFAAAMSRVKLAVQLSAYRDETSAHCHWHIPEAHFLESWGDVLAYDGTASIIQPLIEPLFGGKSAHELLDCFLQMPPRGDYEIVREFWRGRNLWSDFEKGWRKAVHDGVVAGTELKPVDVTLRNDFALAPSAPARNESLELCFRPDPSIWDGRFANNAWLQELPRPFSKLTWDNALLISPALAQLEKLQNGELVSVELSSTSPSPPPGKEVGMRGHFLTAPVWIMPGQANETITLHCGYGRTRTGHVGHGVGINAFAVRASDTFWHAPIASLRKLGRRHEFAATQTHHTVAGREIFHETTFQEFRRNPLAAHEHAERVPPRNETLYHPNEFPPADYAWGMVIDLNTCIGCNACIVACQAENNTPVVGKEQVRRGREMHWLRVDTYFRGDAANPIIGHQPVPCMHCENAPCELVCPVEATLHDSEGLNVQVYNRCVGTRYCSNNCPYKVRRFNFLQFADQKTPTLQLLHNPNVTVRTRGVMEKCTYCIQRISAARIAAEKENRPVRDGEIRTACQQACPAQAITFGNLRDPQSKVNRLRAHPLNYGMLAELNTRPRTTYLAKLRNPNSELQNSS
jgi:MoCo/4Fe-4S cofactor protein with predicted Tat translocation signal